MTDQAVGIRSEIFWFFFRLGQTLSESTAVSPTNHLPPCCRSNQFQLTSWTAACASLGGNYRFHYGSNLQMRCVTSITSANLEAAGLRIVCHHLVLSRRSLWLPSQWWATTAERIGSFRFVLIISLLLFLSNKSMCTFPPSIKPQRCVWCDYCSCLRW